MELQRLDDLVTDRAHGVQRIHRALEDDRDVHPAVRPHRLLAAGEDVDPLEQDPARGAGARREQTHDRQRRRRLPAARLTDEPEALARLEREVHALHRMQLASVLEVEPDVEVLDLQQRRRHSASFPRPTSGRSRNVRADRCATRSRGLSASSSAPPTRLQARMSIVTSTPGGTIAHHAPVEIAARSNAFSMILPERDGARIAQTEERERGLVEDRDGDGEDSAGDQQWRDLRQHVPHHDPRVARAERPRSLHVHTLAHALHLRPDHARRTRPEQDPDHDDDVEEARPPDRGHDDHQRDIGDDEEVVGDPHEQVVDPAAEVARDDTDGASNHHRDEGRREADDERGAQAPDEERDHVDAPVVEAEQVLPRRMAEHRPDLLMERVRRDPRREDR